MKVTLDIPEEFVVASLTLVAPRMPDGGVHTFTHCFQAKNEKAVRVSLEDTRDGTPWYVAREEMTE